HGTRLLDQRDGLSRLVQLRPVDQLRCFLIFLAVPGHSLFLLASGVSLPPFVRGCTSWWATSAIDNCSLTEVRGEAPRPIGARLSRRPRFPCSAPCPQSGASRPRGRWRSG